MKENFIKSTLILIIGGFITKLLGMLIKIKMARYLSSEGLGLYMMILPTFSLLINLSQFGFPLALTKRISEENRNNKKLFFSCLPLLMIIHIFMITLVVLLAPFISHVLLKNKNTYPSLLAIALVLPFTSISSLCRSYFLGKGKMFPHVLSNIIENIVRLLIIVFLIPYTLPLGITYSVCLIILSNIISEIASTIILILFLPSNVRITKDDLKPNKKYLKDSLQIGIPTTANRLVGSLGYFLEPILLTNILLKNNYSLQTITKEYGIITGYVFPLILLPSFFTMAISQALLPIISKEYSNHQKKRCQKKINLAIFFSFIIALPITILFIKIPHFFLNLIYHTQKGIPYIRFLAPICLLQYIQAPLSSSLDAMGKSKDNLTVTMLGTMIRISCLFIFASLKIGIWSLPYATSISILTTTIYQITKVKKYLK